MRNVQSFNALIENTMITNRDKESLTGHKGAALQYCGVARKIQKTRIMFESYGLQRGARGALCDCKRAIRICAYLDMVTYGTVLLPVQYDFTTAADLLSMTEQNRNGQSVKLSSFCKIIEIGRRNQDFEQALKNQSNDIYIKTKHSYRTAC